MRYVTSKINSIHDQNSSLYKFFELRKKLFVDTMGWNIPHDGKIERDQYDTPHARYVIAIDENGNVLGGARILRTSHRHKGWSYMIRDAAKGLLKNIPSQIVEETPSNFETCEITRLTVDPELPSEQRNSILELVSEAAYQEVSNMGGQYVIALTSPFFLRWFSKNGYTVSRLGPIIRDGVDRYCVMGGAVMPSSVPQTA